MSRSCSAKKKDNRTPPPPTYARPAPPSPGEGASGTPPCPFSQGSSQTRRRRASCGVVSAPLTDITPATAVARRHHPCDGRGPTRSSEPPVPPPSAGPGSATDRLRLPASARRAVVPRDLPNPRLPPLHRSGRGDGPSASPGLRPLRALA